MKHIFLSYIKLKTFSGQTGATLQIEKYLSEEVGYQFSPIYLFPLDRTGRNRLIVTLEWFLKTLYYSYQILKIFFTSKPILYINIGQSLSSFFRVLWWFLPLKLLRPGIKVVTSLHGNSFLYWRKDSREMYWFMKILNLSNVVTVLSQTHVDFLKKLELNEKLEIRIVYNTNDTTNLSKNDIELKINKNPDKIHILFLSLLIESKGYIEYLGAIELLAKSELKIPINAILCGPINISRYCTKFKDALSAEDWIENQIAIINKIQPDKLNIQWIKGAYGSQKDQYFQEADIFVFPSLYPNESMPLVLLEAMSAGCAIISTTTGEILDILDEKIAFLEPKLSEDKICYYLKELIENDSLRKSFALEGYRKVKAKFSPENYKMNWINIFHSLQ